MPTPLTLPAFDDAVYQEAEALGRHLFANQFLVAFECWPHRCCYVSPHAEHVTGYANKLVDFELLHNAIHPDDLPLVRRASELAAAFTQYLDARHGGPGPAAAPAGPRAIGFSVDYRLRCCSGEFRRVLRQDFVLAQDGTGRPLATGSVFTDISNHKTAPEVRLSLDHPDFMRWLHARKSPAPDDVLSGREQEIMVRMLVGESNADIAESLFISDLTLKTHRRNIHRKLRTDETSQPPGPPPTERRPPPH